MLANETKNRAGAANQPSDQQAAHSDDIAISVKNLTKKYRIFGHPGDRIKQALTFGRVRFHKEFTALQDVSFEIKKERQSASSVAMARAKARYCI